MRPQSFWPSGRARRYSPSRPECFQIFAPTCLAEYPLRFRGGGLCVCYVSVVHERTGPIGEPKSDSSFAGFSLFRRLRTIPTKKQSRPAIRRAVNPWIRNSLARFVGAASGLFAA